MFKPPAHRRVIQGLLPTTLAFYASVAAAQGCGAVGDGTRFAAFHDNYALVNQMRNNGWAPRDERAVRGQLSVKYSFVGCPQRREKESRALKPAPVNSDVTEEVAKTPGAPSSFWQRLRSAELFASYTNRFDFYLGSRDSGPVINRVSNPGLHLRLPVEVGGNEDDRRDAWQLSLEHMSDGQVVEPVTNARDQLLAQRAYERSDRHFFDTISRGMNFVALQREWVWKRADNEPSFDLRAKIKHYVGSDSSITWGPLAGQGLRFADYERIAVRFGMHLPHFGRFELTSQIGDRGLRRASHTLGWQGNLRWERWNIELPLYVQAHFGPMNTLSNYTQRQDSLGIGFRLAY